MVANWRSGASAAAASISCSTVHGTPGTAAPTAKVSLPSVLLSGP
jgi:hypothetical protein